MTLASPRAVARFATDAECVGWNALICANPGGGEVWAGDEYLRVKARRGRYLPRRVIVEFVNGTSVAVGVLAKKVPLLGEWWHLPAGPAGESPSVMLEAAAAVADLARSHGSFMLKIEPRLGRDAYTEIRAADFLDTIRIIPNPSTILVDLHGSEAEVFARIGKKARNSINRSVRDGIEATAVEATDENCAKLYRLLEETAEGRFVLRSSEYYRDFWQSFDAAGNGKLFFAERDGELIAGAFAMRLGAKSTYKDGASVRAKTAYGASHALQWAVMRWAIAQGVTLHDLCGAPPSDRVDDRTHPLYGVGQFKRSFSPEITDYVGAFDLPLKPAAYRFWTKIGDRIARRVSLAVAHDPYY